MKRVCILAVALYFIQISATAQYPQYDPPYYSQNKQDRFVNERIFKGKRNGVFVDVGAHDGISYSNTYYFEKELGWTGICIEPHPSIFALLKKNRLSQCYALCVGKNNETIDFLKINGAPEMLSGIKNKYDKRHLERISREVNICHGSIETIKVPCKTLSQLLEENNIFEVDLLSIDVEGSEMDVLLGIDFKRFLIKCIVIENNYPDTFGTIRKLLLMNGYNHFATIEFDEFFTLSTLPH